MSCLYWGAGPKFFKALTKPAYLLFFLHVIQAGRDVFSLRPKEAEGLLQILRGVLQEHQIQSDEQTQWCMQSK